MDAGAFQHGTRRATGDDAGTGRRRSQQYHARRLLPLHRMRDGALDPGNGEEVLLRLLHALGDRRRHLLGLAIADTDCAVAVTDHDECREAEPPTALDYLCHPLDRDHALDIVAFLGRLATTPIVTTATLPTDTATSALGLGYRHSLYSPFLLSEAKAALAGAVRQGGDSTVIFVAGPGEDHLLYSGSFCPLGHQAAH